MYALSLKWSTAKETTILWLYNYIYTYIPCGHENRCGSLWGKTDNRRRLRLDGDRGVYSQRALYTCMRIAYVAQHSKNKKNNYLCNYYYYSVTINGNQLIISTQYFRTI